MTNADRSAKHVNSCVARHNPIKDIRSAARTGFEHEFSLFDHRDPLIIEGVFPEVRVFYICAKASDSVHRTYVDCRFHFDSREMWIGSIQVAASHRHRGFGRGLVRAVEATAVALGMKEIRILPTPSAVEFWLKLDYLSDPRAARVLWKNSGIVAENQASAEESVVHEVP